MESLDGALRTLEGHLAALDSESDQQSAALSRLDATVALLSARADVRRPETHEPTEGDVVTRLESSVREPSCDQRPADPSVNFVLPDIGQHWDAYLHNVERYIAHNGIHVPRDPLQDVLYPRLAKESRQRFDEAFRSAPWDRWDYGVVGLSVLVGAITDYVLVATPGGSFKGQPQRGSPVTAWLKEQSRKLAPNAHRSGIELSPFQKWVTELTTRAEDWAKVPYDVVSPKVGLTPRVHRLSSLGHDPLLGLVFGVCDIIRGSCTFIDKAGAWRVIDASRDDEASFFQAIAKVAAHGFSDVFTPQGLPPPFFALFQLVDAKPGFTLKEGGHTVSVRDLVRYMYSNGYDLRHMMTMSISPAIAEIILWSYHAVRACGASPEPPEVEIAERLKREQMVTLAHALLASANVLKTALYGWNPSAINLAQFVILATRLLSLAKLASERDRLIGKRLEKGWRVLLANAPGDGAPA